MRFLSGLTEHIIAANPRRRWAREHPKRGLDTDTSNAGARVPWLGVSVPWLDARVPWFGASARHGHRRADREALLVTRPVNREFTSPAMGVVQTIAKLGGMTSNELEQWGGRFKVVWQEGHLEKKKPDRSRWTVHEEASEQVDELAKQAMREVQPGGRVRPYPSAQRWRLLYQGEEVTGDVIEAIQTVAVQTRLDAYATTKTGQLAGGRVEWQVLRQVVKGCESITRRVQAVKILAGFAATTK
eukprot:1190470-Prorocentrum_minimum.AAC.6